MLNKEFQPIYKNLFLTYLVNILFVSFIFLFSVKYDNFQIRVLIFTLLFPCILKIIYEKNFSKIKIFLSFFLLLITHSILNIYFESSKFTQYNFYGIISLSGIFLISLYYFDKFNKNIKNIINLFLIVFFASIFISLFKFEPDAPYFCGGIKIYKILSFADNYLPQVINLEDSRNDLKLSFKEFIFLENSHLGMVAPGVIIFSIFSYFKKSETFTRKVFALIFILLCLIKSSTTLLVGTILSIILISFFNFKMIPKTTLKIFTLIVILFSSILILDKECRSRFVPIYEPTLGTTPINTDNLKKEVLREKNDNFSVKFKNLMETSGNLSSAIHYRAFAIAKNSILEKPFGWGINRYDAAFEIFNKRNPSEIDRLNTFNNKDGTNNFVKIIVEFGVFGLLIYLFIFLFLINKKIPIELKMFYIPFIITQSLRGAGYFNGGFSLILFLMLFTFLKIYKKAQ